MKHNSGGEPKVGIGLLLSGSDAFKHLAEELAAAHNRWHAAGADPATLEWARRLAEHAGWWCGRLEGEADAVVAAVDSVTRLPVESSRRRRRQHRG